METDLSTLKLSIEKGPREGEVFEFNSKPGLTIRLGRVLRGNTVVIKDNGVSSKHLSIDWSGRGKWIVKDLDSSNGTFLNTSLLQPLAVSDLRDGDELKIGEFTSIRVRVFCVSDLQLMDRNRRRVARVLGAEKLDDGEMAEEGNRRGRGRGRRQGRHCGDEVVNFVHDASELEASASMASVNCEVDCNLPEVRVRRGRSRGMQKDRNLMDEGSKIPPASLEIDVNLEGIKLKRGRAGKRKNTSSERTEDKVEIVGERSKKAGDGECKAKAAKPSISLRRSTRRMKNNDNAALTSVLERIPEASQLVDPVNCEMVEVASPAQNLNTQARQGPKKTKIDQKVTLEDKESKEELNEGGQVSRRAIHDERSPSEAISVQENCMELEQPCEERVSHVVKNDGKLASEQNFEDSTCEDVELNLNIDDGIGGIVSEESTADDNVTQKEAEATIDLDWKNMTLGKWFDQLERFLPKQIRNEADQIVEDALKKSQKFHEFILLQQK